MRWNRIFFCALFLFIACKETPKKSLKTEAITFTKEGKLQLFKKDSLLVQLDIEIAETDYETQTGLMYRNAMEEKQGMLFIFKDERVHSFYMKNTEIPLDILYLGADFKVRSIQKNAVPFDETGLSSKVPVQYVLEINAGLTEKWGITENDSIAFPRIK